MIAVLKEEYAQARDWFERSLALNREVGDAWMVALCYHNLGNATRGLCDFASARSHYIQSLRAFSAYGDRWALAFLFEDVGILAALTGDARGALELIGAADALREAIGAPRAPSLLDEIAKPLAAAAAGLSDDEQRACTSTGRSLDLVAAVDRALELSEGAGSRTRGNQKDAA